MQFSEQQPHRENWLSMKLVLRTFLSAYSFLSDLRMTLYTSEKAPDPRDKTKNQNKWNSLLQK